MHSFYTVLLPLSPQKVKDLTNLIEKNIATITQYEQKNKIIQHDLLQVNEKRSSLCSSLEEKGRKQIIILQQKWKNDERKRLSQLTTQRTAELKKEAAKALEPELRRIVQEHKVSIERKRKEVEMDFKTAGEEMKLNYEEEYTAKRRDVELEERDLFKKIDEDYEHKIKLLRLEHEKQMGETRILIEEKHEKARTFRLALMQKEEDLKMAKVKKLQLENEKKISEIRRLSEAEIVQLQKDIDEKMKHMVELQNTYVCLSIIILHI